MSVLPLSWLLYADHRLAPICRSRSGSLTPIIRWTHYADHTLAPICRSVTLGEHMTAQRIGSRIPVALAGEPEMLLGADFLRAHRLLISNSTRQLVFTYEGGPVFQVPKPAQTIAAPAIGSAQSDPVSPHE